MKQRRPFGPKISAFLAAIRVMPNVTRAAKAAKINKSQHYAKRKSSPEYEIAFEQAMQMGCDALSDVAVTRATDGWEEPVVYQGRVALQAHSDTGELVPVTVRKIDNQLLMFVLKSRHPDYRERLEHSGKLSGTVKAEATPEAVLLTDLCSPQQLEEMRAKLVARDKVRSECPGNPSPEPIWRE
jgi:hypothetical protein